MNISSLTVNNQYLTTLSTIKNNDTTSDLFISDSLNNTIAIFEDGHFRTKNFNSKNIINNVDDESTADLSFSDNDDNVLVLFIDGHIKTKNFDSRNIPGGGGGTNYYERPSTGKYCFTVDVNVNIADLDTDASVGDTYLPGVDYGYVALPTNYSTTGDPVRLIIYCHGAGTSISEYTSPSYTFSSHYACWNKLGYAFMDMFANPPAFSGGSTELHLGNPMVLQCYRKGYEFVQRHFNIKRDGIFVIGSSMGGISSFLLALSGIFPIIAQVGNCPCVDLFKQAYVFPWNLDNRSLIANYFKFEGKESVTFTNDKPASEPERRLFINNIELWRGYNPILMKANDDVINNILSYVPGVSDSEAWNTLYDAGEEAAYANLRIDFPCPLKVFHCKNDNSVLYRYSEYIVNAIRKAGGQAWLRPFTNGGHSAWACGEDVPVTDIDGNSFTMKASTYEAYLFYKRYDN